MSESVEITYLLTLETEQMANGLRQLETLGVKTLHVLERLGLPPDVNEAIKLSGDMNNNKMERFNGEIRDREKTMRGIKKNDTPILTGYQIFHNYIREHEGLEGKTPAEACGITVQGKNKWTTLIQNAKLLNKTSQVVEST
jgi:hypothetical protein